MFYIVCRIAHKFEYFCSSLLMLLYLPIFPPEEGTRVLLHFSFLILSPSIFFLSTPHLFCDFHMFFFFFPSFHLFCLFFEEKSHIFRKYIILIFPSQEFYIYFLSFYGDMNKLILMSNISKNELFWTSMKSFGSIMIQHM